MGKNILANAPWGLKLRAAVGAFVSLFDATTDVFMLLSYLRYEGYHTYALITGGLLAISIFCQLIVVLIQNKGAKYPVKAILYESIPVLLFVKPVVDAYRVAASMSMKSYQK